MYSKKKRVWINNKIKQIEEICNETRKFFKEAHFLHKQQ